MSEALGMEVARLATRLADFLTNAFPGAEGSVGQNVAFLRAASRSAALAPAAVAGTDRLARLSRKLGFTPAEVDLLLLSGMPEEHEGFAAGFRTLHPRNEPRPSVGLAAQLFAAGSRPSFLNWFHGSGVIRSGAVLATGDGPFFEKSLEPATALWSALHGCDDWPASLPELRTPTKLHGLDDWLGTPGAQRARVALDRHVPCTVLVTADSEEAAFQRGMALVHASGRQAVAFVVPGPTDPGALRLLRLHALARDVVPVLRLTVPDGPGLPEAPSFEGYPDTIAVCGRTGALSVQGARPLVPVVAGRLQPLARRAMWSQALPGLEASAPLLAARYPIEPGAAREIAEDLGCLEGLENRTATTEDVAAAIRARAALALSGGIQLIRPTATWSQLILPRDREEQLRAALARLELQALVLDEWGFLKDRPGARGVRMLFTGPPGTGKTLSAEVLAGALNVDLLFVDISRVVSKWIGETEKNLSTVFDTAERARAVLFFDEADALFGRRTEVSDAHDRYANLETAYLLARLERFEGLAILASNLRQNIDAAFVRRLDFIVEYDEPDREERRRLWKCHIPDLELLDKDANLDELATLYPVVGGLIRNAAVAAAFLAAADGGRIARHHFLRAIRREYEKSGKAFPGLPPGMKTC